MRRPTTVIVCSTPSTSTSSTSWVSPSRSSSSSRSSRAVAPVVTAPVRMARVRTARSRRLRSWSSTETAAARVPPALARAASSCPLTARNADSSATSSGSAAVAVGARPTEVARQRSLHSSNRRASPVATAWRCAISASSAPWAVVLARSSVAPSVSRCSSSTSSPRLQAATTARPLPTVSATNAWPNQPTLRRNAEPRCRARATRPKWTAARSGCPAARAIRPASR